MGIALVSYQEVSTAWSAPLTPLLQEGVRSWSATFLKVMQNDSAVLRRGLEETFRISN